jgi:DNA-3-methyladenine glycosylase
MPNAAPKARRSSSGAPLTADFYDRDAAIVARDLLGAILEHRSPEGIASGRIVEVEAYLGPHDPACHAATGPSARNRHLHGPPGRAYVYFIYGMHHCLNLAADRAGRPGCVLIRAAEPLASGGLAPGACRGPGRLARALGIHARHSGGFLFERGARLYLREGPPPRRVGVSTRVGISRAGDRPLRFFDADSAEVSRGPRPAKLE